MFKEWTYVEATKHAAAIKELGLQDDIWLSDKTEKPWHLVTSLKPGGTHRFDIDTSVWFYAYDPDTDIHFRWAFDIEPPSANGSSTYHIDVKGCHNVLAKLPLAVKGAFVTYLRQCAVEVSKQSKEVAQTAARLAVEAEQLRNASFLEEN